MVLCCGVCWKSTAIIGILINLTKKEPCLLVSLDLYSKPSVSDDKFCRKVYSEPLTSCKGKMGGLPERPCSRVGCGWRVGCLSWELKLRNTFVHNWFFKK